MADTVGYAHPAQIKSGLLKASVRAEVGAKLEGLHLHDTMGLGLANALAGLEEGIRSFDSSPRRPGRLSLSPPAPAATS